MARWATRFRPALHDESGGVTVLALFSLFLTALCLGFAIDATNLYRHQAMLRMTADAAAHAGASALARGETPEAAEAAALEMIALNMPTATAVSLLADRATDLRAMVVNPKDGTLSKPDPDTPANGVLVSLQQSERTLNAIPTFVLGLFGVESWSTGTTSVAMVASTQRCSNAAGFYSRGPITFDSSGLGALPADGICVHSQQALYMPTERALSGGEPHLSLPARNACSGGGCETAAEVNLIMPDIAAYVALTAKRFSQPGYLAAEKRTFFSSRPISEDLEPLIEVGADVRGLRTGDVVQLSPFRFGLLRQVPPGLTYLVTCGQPGAEVETGGKEEIVVGMWPEAPMLKNMALVTNCPIRLAEYARVEGSVIITTASDSGFSTADVGARIGDAEGACDPSRQSIVMTTGDVAFPSSLLTSNIAVVAGGDVLLGLGGESKLTRGRGISVHSGGEIRGNGTQIFQPCVGAEDKLLPSLRIISYMLSPVEGWVTPVNPPVDRELPGSRPEALDVPGARS